MLPAPGASVVMPLRARALQVRQKKDSASSTATTTQTKSNAYSDTSFGRAVRLGRAVNWLSDNDLDCKNDRFAEN